MGRFLTLTKGTKVWFWPFKSRNKKRNRFCLFLLNPWQFHLVSVCEDFGSRVKEQIIARYGRRRFLCFFRSCSAASHRVNENNTACISTELWSRNSQFTFLCTLPGKERFAAAVRCRRLFVSLSNVLFLIDVLLTRANQCSGCEWWRK